MSFTRDLLVGLKGELLAAGVTAPIVFGDLPSTPDRVIGIGAYAAIDDPTTSHSTLRVQLMVRGVPNSSLDADDLADDIFQAIQALEDRTYGSTHLVQCLRVSAVPMGIDTFKRSARSDNYEVDVDLPVSAGRPF